MSALKADMLRTDTPLRPSVVGGLVHRRPATDGRAAEFLPLTAQAATGRRPHPARPAWTWPTCPTSRGPFGRSPYPDLRIAARLCERCGADAVCGTYPFVGELDPHDPYWSLACVGGQWYLASTDGTRLMRPYTDGTREFPGDEAIRLVRPVVVPE